MSAIADTLQSLRLAFPNAVFGLSASQHSLDALVRLVGELPPEFAAFPRLCDGVDLRLADGVVGQIFDVAQMQHVLGFADQLRQLQLLPIRNDGCGSYDCIDVGGGPTRGAVFFWDHEVYERPAYLLGGDFAAYLDMWADHVKCRFRRDGSEDPAYRPQRLDEWPWAGASERTHPWPFDEEWMRRRDPRANELLGDRFLRKRLVPRGEP